MHIIATIKPWNIENFKKIKSKKYLLISDPKKLKIKNLLKYKIKYIFFPHWSQKVPKKIVDNYFCICFHETDLPDGRGGSPIQNLILRNKQNSKITAFKMTNKIDAGPILMKEKFSLNGSAEEIYNNCSKIIFRMIKKIVKSKINLKPQNGKIIYYKRLKNNSKIDFNDNSLIKIYNKIRMLDAETYPRAIIEKNDFNYEFSSVKNNGNSLEAKVIIKKKKIFKKSKIK